jgi:hypothetical protein
MAEWSFLRHLVCRKAEFCMHGTALSGCGAGDARNRFWRELCQFDVEKTADLTYLSWTRAVGSVASDGVLLKAVSPDGKTYLKLSSYDSFRGFFGLEAVNEYIY